MTRRAEERLLVPPRWQVLPPGAVGDDGRIPIYLVPGGSFGDGRHPTTQLCLQGIAACAPRGVDGWRMLDFGCGSGILAIAAARLGARVDAVDVNLRALEEATGNLRHNGAGERVRLARGVEAMCGPYPLIVANILCGVLLDVAETLVSRLAAQGSLLLSGLVATDVPLVSARYAGRLGGRAPQIMVLGEWRALLWRAQADT
jgi:ribosomal protein L11 methyltransferase